MFLFWTPNQFILCIDSIFINQENCKFLLSNTVQEGWCVSQSDLDVSADLGCFYCFYLREANSRSNRDIFNSVRHIFGIYLVMLCDQALSATLHVTQPSSDISSSTYIYCDVMWSSSMWHLLWPPSLWYLLGLLSLMSEWTHYALKHHIIIVSLLFKMLFR